MFQFFTQHRVLMLVLLLVLIGLHLLSGGLRHKTQLNFFDKVILVVYTPIYKILSWPFAKSALLISKYLYLVDLKESNARLRLQNRELKGLITDGDELRAENERLKTLLQLKSNEQQPVAFARVIGRSNNAEFRTMLIDAGTMDGVQVGMSAVAPEGLVGFIAGAVPNAAKVVLITDASARIDAIIQRTRTRAMVFGRGADACALEYLESGVDVAEGDRLITSGLGGVFPKGLPIGVIAGVTRGDYGVLQETDIQPAVDLDALEEVAVLPGGHGMMELLR